MVAGAAATRVNEMNANITIAKVKSVKDDVGRKAALITGFGGLVFG